MRILILVLSTIKFLQQNTFHESMIILSQLLFFVEVKITNKSTKIK